MKVVGILVGLLVLFFGRELYWLFVGGIGFITAMYLADYMASSMSDWLLLIIALIAGLAGALLAIWAQKILVGLAGFFAGGSIVLGFLDVFSVQKPKLAWVPILLGAVIGLISAITLFDWALIVLSSLSGALLLAQNLPVSSLWMRLVFIIALAVGLVTQISWMQRNERDRIA